MPYKQKLRPEEKVKIVRATPHNSRLTPYAPLRQAMRAICIAKMLDNTQSIICAFCLASVTPRLPYRHVELCGIALGNIWREK